MFVCSFYNPTKGFQYRYAFNDFKKLLNAIPNKRDGCILCGDLNFPSTNWNTFSSKSGEESRVIDLLDSNIIQLQLKFPTYFGNILDVAFCRNIALSALVDIISTKSMTVLIKYQPNFQSIVLLRYPDLSFRISEVWGLWTISRYETLCVKVSSNPFVSRSSTTSFMSSKTTCIN